MHDIERLGRANPALLVELQRATAAQQVIRDQQAGELACAHRPPRTNRSPQAVPSGWSFRYASRSAVVGKPSSVTLVAER